jgi:hypothetical protein
MTHDFFQTLLENNTRKYVFLGGPGSGKSELAVHYALNFARLQRANINFLDMDQSKPLCRSRDVRKNLIDKGIRFHSGEQFLDTPIVPKGVETTLKDSRNLVILDVGGGPAGASNIGQYAEFLNGSDTVAYFVINYYRPFSKTTKQIEETIHSVLRAAAIKDVEIISNPFSRADGGLEDLKTGHQKIVEILGDIGKTAKIVAVPDTLWGGCQGGFGKHILKIKPCINLV